MNHLSQDQIDDQLIGDHAAIAAAHLAECELCVARLAEAAAPIEDLKAVALAWSERRSATLPLHQTMARSATFHPRLAWAAAVAAALAIGVAIPVVSHQHQQQTAQTHVQVQPVTVAANNASANNEIVQDNQMLKAIDRELDAAADSPEALGLTPVSGAAPHKFQPPSSVQD